LDVTHKAPSGVGLVPLRAPAIWGLGPHVELHSAHGVVAVSPEDAHIRRIRIDHLANVEGVRLWQRLQYGACHQTYGAHSTLSSVVSAAPVPGALRRDQR